jgi:hypothetical protein
MNPMDRRRFLRTSAAAGLVSLPSFHEGEAQEFLDALATLAHDHPTAVPVDYPVRPVPPESVDITDTFWRPRMQANRNVSLGHCFERFEGGNAFSVSKLIEAAAYMLEQRPDSRLVEYVDGRIEQMLAGLASRVQAPAQSVRVSGHFFEAAVAYAAATGKREILDAAIRVADQMDSAYGPGKATYISGHEGLKIGLVSLYRATNDERYWRLAKFFADQRGRDDYERTGEYALDRTYAQDHRPVIEQTEAVGHCVRATFLYIAMTDIAALAGSEAYTRAIDRIWQDTALHKTYVTGGIGSIRFHEQFGAPFELPNLSAWNETCAAYGSAVWNHRLFLLRQDARYIDVMERVLYNALLVGVSLRGDRFFYQNPLMSFGDYDRFEWINVPCCPPNVVRMIASIGGYVYAHDATGLWVNLFVNSRTQMIVGATRVTVRQETGYPWDGTTLIQIDPASDASFAVHVRIPGWARDTVLPGDLYAFADEAAPEPVLLLNGEPLPLVIDNGYVRIERQWTAGDVIQLHLPMPVRRVVAHPDVQDDQGRVALQRGPLVYCAEWPDNGRHALDLVVPEDALLDSEYRPDLLGGVQVIRGDVRAIERTIGGTVRTVDRHFTAIPYYAWANRGMGEMAVWLAREPEHAWIPPVLPPHIASITTSGGVEKAWTGYNDQNDDIGAVFDGREPLNSADQSYRFFRMRPPVGEPAWLEYAFRAPTRISSARAYWFDDKRFCRLPDSWRILYRDGDAWRPVVTSGTYRVEKDAFSTISFEPVTTTAVRVEVEPQTVAYRAGEIGPPGAMFLDEDIAWREFGIIEWEVR